MNQYTLFNFNKKEKKDEKLPPLIFQKEVSLLHININKKVKERLLKKFTYFFPNQVEFVSSFFQIPINPSVVESNINYIVQKDKVILKKFNNYLITTDTSSGKTIIAILYMIKFLDSVKKGTAIYSVPMRSLGNEKFREFSQLFKGIANVHLIMGNEEKESEKKLSKNILITTNEKFDQLLRSKKNLQNIICVVFDELHLLNTNRGTTIEWCVAKIKEMHIPRMGLSATIENDKEISEWMEAGLIHSSFRPIPIKIGFLSNKITFIDKYGEIEEVVEIPNQYIEKSKSPIEGFLLHHIEKKDSVLYFRHSRASVASTAKKLAKLVKKRKKIKTSLQLPEIKGGIGGIDDTLNECIKWGVAFHHAGLSSKNKAFIENKFRKRKLYTIIATPTLAIGVNVPAKWVIMDYKAYRNGKYDEISTAEIKQMMGRAARPQYDKEGFALIYNEKLSFDLQTHLNEKYFSGECEAITSQYNGFDDLLMSLLGFVSDNIANTISKLVKLYKNTLIYYQSKSFQKSVKNDLKDALNYFDNVNPSLIEKKDGKWITTEFGNIVSTLYIHPSIALNMSDFIVDDYDKSDFAIVYFLFSHGGLRPLRKKSSDDNMINSIISIIKEYEIDLFGGEPYDLQAIKTTGCLIGNEYHNKLTWADEDTEEDEFMKLYGLSSGDLTRLIGIGGNFQWIFYSFRKIAHYHHRNDLIEKIKSIEIRLKYGISNDLVSLCKIKYVGKSYAKQLYHLGYRDPKDLKIEDIEKISKIKTKKGFIGIKTAEKIVKESLSIR